MEKGRKAEEKHRQGGQEPEMIWIMDIYRVWGDIALRRAPKKPGKEDEEDG